MKLSQEQRKRMIAEKKLISIHGQWTITAAGLREILISSCSDYKIKVKLHKFYSKRNLSIFKATVSSKSLDRSAQAYGDSSPKNVKSHVSPHRIRVGDTRAVNRATIRFLGLDLLSYEEFKEAAAISWREEMEKGGRG